jgi:RNA polymerase sigma-70 factor (ECF subfamily)
MTLALDLRLISPTLEMLEDATLVSVARTDRDTARRDAAFDELVKRHAPRLHAVASRIVGREEAYDVVQDAFVSAYRALGSFRDQAQFTTWMHRITLNCCYARLRKYPDAANDLEMPTDPSDDRPSPIEVAERRDLREALEGALSRIKAEFRETFVLVEFGDLDYAEVADVLGVQVGTIKSRMSRAREALREILEAQGYRP